MGGARDTVVNIAERRRQLGVRSPLARQVCLDDIAVGATFVPADRAIELDLVTEAVADGLIVEGRIGAPWEGECRRCLEAVEGTVTVAVRELFAEAGDPDETYAIDGDAIDLEPMVRDALMLNLPQLPLCREDCAGPAPDRYPARPASDDPRIDPRWAGLAELDLDR